MVFGSKLCGVFNVAGPDEREDLIEIEWLLKDFYPRPVYQDLRRPLVGGHQNRTAVREPFRKCANQLNAIHFGHHDVGDQRMWRELLAGTQGFDSAVDCESFASV